MTAHERKVFHMFGRWPTYTGNVTGIVIKGDPDMPQTRIWNRLLLQLFIWNKATVVTAMTATPVRIRIGFKPLQGRTQISPKVFDTAVSGPHFAVLRGHEEFTLFAINHFGTEVPLQLNRQTRKWKLRNIPLL